MMILAGIILEKCKLRHSQKNLLRWVAPANRNLISIYLLASSFITLVGIFSQIGAAIACQEHLI